MPSARLPKGMVRMLPSGLSSRYGAPSHGVSSRKAISSAYAVRACTGSSPTCATASGTASYEYTSEAEPRVDLGLVHMSWDRRNVISALKAGGLVQHPPV